MKQFIKNHWKEILLILIIILGFLFYYEVLPIYNRTVFNLGYDSALNDLADRKLVMLNMNNGNQTQLISLEVCSQTFQQQYQNICGGLG